MAFMGYETPVEMPSMGVYNTDLMKMYIAGVKEQYDLAREEMKDFMKLYLLFNSDLPGQALLYNDLTIGGALKLIGDLYSRGIDPYKSPEARAVIALYINSAPIGKLREMERSAENAKIYKQNLANVVNNPNWDPDYNRYMIGGDLETWDPNKPWTATTPYLAPDLKETVVPYLQLFKKDENLGPTPDRKGYIRFGTSELNQQLGISGALEKYANSPYGQYKYLQAVEAANRARHEDGTPLSSEEKAEYAQRMFQQPVRNIAAQFFQPKDELDPLYKSDYDRDNRIKEYWATTGSNKSNKDNDGDGYLALHDAVIKGFSSRAPLVDGVSYDSYQSYFVLNTKSPTQCLNELSFDVNPNMFASYNGRTALGGSNNVIAYESGDYNNLYSDSELVAKMINAPKGFKPTKYGENARGHMKQAYVKDNANGVTRTFQGKGVGILENDGLIHIYLRELVKSKNTYTGQDGNEYTSNIGNDRMWYDSGYRYNPDDYTVNRNLSINALVRDADASKKSTSLKLEQIKNN